MDSRYELLMKVRFHECDTQGIVNNANYLHYLETTRHEFLEDMGVSFTKLHEQGIDPVVARIDIQYKTSLREGDRFVCRLNVERKGVKLAFQQTIHRESDNKLCCKATVEVVIMENGKLTRGDFFDELLGLV